MEVVNVRQGSREWKELRNLYNTASEAPAMMGDSKYKKRDRLLADKHGGGDDEPVHPAVQKRFDSGHKSEADIRPAIEEMLGEPLYPITAIRGGLLASLDGLVMSGDKAFEHKDFNQELIKAIHARNLSDHYKWQMDQQMYVTGAERVLFVCSDGTRENMHWMWYERDESRIERLLAGWEQFDKDLVAYEPPTLRLVETPDEIAGLPDIQVGVTAVVSYSNADVFAERVLFEIDRMPTELVTDKHFANAESNTKWCKATEKKIDNAMALILEQAPDIQAVFKSLESVQSSLRDKRLQLEKLVKAEKAARQDAIIAEAVKSVGNEERLRAAAKGKKTLETFQSAVNDEVARIKIEPAQAEPEATPSNDAQYITITYKDLKSGPRLLEVTGTHGILMDLCASGDGKIKTIQIGV